LTKKKDACSMSFGQKEEGLTHEFPERQTTSTLDVGRWEVLSIKAIGRHKHRGLSGRHYPVAKGLKSNYAGSSLY